MKFKKQGRVILMYTLLAICAAVIFAVSLYSTFAWFNYVDMTLGSINFASVDVTIVGNLNPLLSENGLIIPGEKIDNQVVLVNANSENKSTQEWVMARVRSGIKLDGQDTDLVALVFPNQESFTYDGEYYYLNRALAPNEEVQLISGVIVSDQIGNIHSGLQVTGKIEVECIQAKYDAYKELWSDAPESWVKQVGLQAFD